MGFFTNVDCHRHSHFIRDSVVYRYALDKPKERRMNDTVQIILAVGFGCVLLAAAFALIVLTIDTIRGWKNEHTD